MQWFYLLITLYCCCVWANPAYASHFVCITMQKDGSSLPLGRHSIDGGNLTISDVAEEDRGVYVCGVSNDAAALSVEAELLVENVPPRAPYNLTARPATTAVHLAWVPGRCAPSLRCHVPCDGSDARLGALVSATGSLRVQQTPYHIVIHHTHMFLQNKYLLTSVRTLLGRHYVYL